MPEQQISLTLPLADEDIRNLHAGDSVLLSGTLVTARDTAHQWLFDRFIAQTIPPSAEDLFVLEQLQSCLTAGLIYHCGPVVSGLGSAASPYQVLSAGPTTSIREEPCQAEIIRFFNLKGVMGKGGMGPKTLQALTDAPALYFHAIGGAAALLARSVEAVLAVFKPEFGMPEAMWILRVRHFPAVITMDAHGRSLHAVIAETSQAELKKLNH